MFVFFGIVLPGVGFLIFFSSFPGFKLGLLMVFTPFSWFLVVAL